MKTLFAFPLLASCPLPFALCILPLALCLLPLALWSQTGWLRHFSPADTLIGIRPLPDGYAFFAHDAAGAYQIRTGPDGVFLDSLPLGPVPADLVAAADGGFFMCFLENGQVNLHKLDGAGALLWDQWLSDTALQTSVALAASPDGGCYAVSASAFDPNGTAPDFFLKSIVQKIAADGSLEWLRTGDPLFWFNGKRTIRDASLMPDGSLLVYSLDRYHDLKTGSRLLLIGPDGTFGPGIDFQPSGAYYSANTLYTARPASDGTVLTAGVLRELGLYTDVTLGYAGAVEWSPLPSESTVYYPLKYLTSHGPAYSAEPWSAAPLPGGDLLVIETEAGDARLWRGSPDLQDTAWVRPLTPAGGFFSEKIRRLNRLIYATPDQGAILGGVDSAGIFLQKIDFWGNNGTVAVRPAPAPAGCLRVQPNPARDRAVVFFPTPDYDQLIVTDLAGRKVRAVESLAGRMDFAIDLRQIPPGVYALAARRRDGAVIYGKLSVH